MGAIIIRRCFFIFQRKKGFYFLTKAILIFEKPSLVNRYRLINSNELKIVMLFTGFLSSSVGG